jgi:hypothetical protein
VEANEEEQKACRILIRAAVPLYHAQSQKPVFRHPQIEMADATFLLLIHLKWIMFSLRMNALRVVPLAVIAIYCDEDW